MIAVKYYPHASRIVNQKRYSILTSAGDRALKVGDVIHGYRLEKVGHIKELNISPHLLRHQATGAEHLHIHKDGDSENVFAIALRTPPRNSTGVSHILEHLTLCGSKKYAVRDPFFKMLTRSLATFMNAMTGSDYTVYPFSTQNRRDYENLMSVYADAVFFPRLRPVDFRQEGWRLEHETPDKKDTPIVIRGVVYNEMKGVFSSSSAIYYRKILNNLFPDTTYRYEYGGDPEEIPKLSHEDLKKFHQLHYHPSNAKFFTYGDMPLQDHLQFISEKVLSKFNENSKARDLSFVQEQVPWTDPRRIATSCPPDPMIANPEKDTTTSISYMLPTTITQYDELFALQLLFTLLIDGPNAPFYKNLLESGLGSDYSPLTGLGSHVKQPFFSVGLKNVNKNDIGKVHDIIENTFEEVANKGFSQERIDAILHDIELSLKHIKGNFGLGLLFNLGSTWNHDGDMMSYFEINKFVDKFRNDLKSKPNYWKELITKNLINNKHKLILDMSPDERFEEKRKEREQNMLEAKISALSDVGRLTVLHEGMELQKIQDTKEDPSILPCLDPSTDISRDLETRTELKFEDYEGISIQLCEQPTNEVVYFRAKVDLSDKMSEDGLMDYLPIFCDVATKLGAGKYNRQQLAQRSQLTTGGLDVTMMVNPSLVDFDKFTMEICYGSHCLMRNIDNMFEIWTNVFQQIHFDGNVEYLHQLIKQSASELSESIPHSGHVYSMKRAAAGMSSISSLDERLSGLTHVARMKDMANKESVSDIARKLQVIASLALDPSVMKCSINTESELMPIAVDGLKKFLHTAKAAHSAKSTSDLKLASLNYEPTKVEDLKFPFATHYVSKALITVPRAHEDFAKLVIMSKLISSKYLLREVREKGGAYGARAQVANSGLLHFYSYRDPNSTKTLEIFNQSTVWLAEGAEYNEQDIKESKLGVFQDVDRPVAPGRRGLNYFTIGETDDMRQEYRRRLLDVSQADVISVSRKYLSQKKFGTFTL